MGIFWQALLNTVATFVAILLIVLLAARSLKHNQGERTWLIAKWILSAAAVFGMAEIGPTLYRSEINAIGGMIGALALATILAVLWTPSLTALFARPFGDLIDGGEQEATAKPHYSAAVARRQAGKFADSIAEIEAQLALFPGDYTGVMMLAAIQAENLNDLTAARSTIESVAADSQYVPQKRAAALSTLADWLVQFEGDGDSARLCFERIIELFPDTELAQGARQRLAHLRTSSEFAAARAKNPIILIAREKDLGLRLANASDARNPEVEPGEQARQLVEQLQMHPEDWDARERLAMVYADHYQRLDMASVELEQLISSPNQPAKRVVHWLNLLAELQVKLGNDEAAACRTLQRIVDAYPKTAAAVKAARAIHYVGVGRRREPEQVAAPDSFERFMRSQQDKAAKEGPQEQAKPGESQA